MGRRTNIEDERAYHRNYYRNSSDEYKAQQKVNRRKWEEENREYIKQYRNAYAKANREKVRRARGTKMLPNQQTIEYEKIIKLDICSYCDNQAATSDHIVALHNKGEGDWTNLTGACQSCNSKKGTLSLLEFLLKVA